VTTTEACASLTSDGIDLIDEDDAWGVFFRLLEHIANPGCTNTDEHLDEIGTRNGEEGHLGFTGNRLRK